MPFNQELEKIVTSYVQASRQALALEERARGLKANINFSHYNNPVKNASGEPDFDESEREYGEVITRLPKVKQAHRAAKEQLDKALEKDGYKTKINSVLNEFSQEGRVLYYRQLVQANILPANPSEKVKKIVEKKAYIEALRQGIEQRDAPALTQIIQEYVKKENPRERVIDPEALGRNVNSPYGEFSENLFLEACKKIIEIEANHKMGELLKDSQIQKELQAEVVKNPAYQTQAVLGAYLVYQSAKEQQYRTDVAQAKAQKISVEEYLAKKAPKNNP